MPQQDTTNRMLKTLGTQAEFHEAWQNLMRQMEALLTVAHSRRPSRLKTEATCNSAKMMLNNVCDQLVAAIEGE